MPSNSILQQSVTLSAAETVELLTRELGGESSRWAIWLANERKPGRVNRRLPQEAGPGRPRYNPDVVQAFMAEYKKEQVQEPQVVPTRGSTRDGRFTPSITALTLADGAEQPAVLLVIPKPLQAFMLTAEEARRIADRLTKAANEIDPGVTS